MAVPESAEQEGYFSQSQASRQKKVEVDSIINWSRRRRVWCRNMCPDGFYGLDCGQMCECRNGARCHHITGACLCTAGWAGPHCILECQEGHFGEQCSQTCECQNGARCDHVTGQCSCTAGWTGDSCQLRQYGEHCSGQCLCQNGGSCDSVTGQCSCPPGWMGAACELECEEGRYGENCTQICGCANRGKCDRVTGRCVCQLGWMGELCQSACSKRFFSEGCERRCDCVHGLGCHHVTGHCECEPGWRGAKCDKWSYGASCGQRCRCQPGAVTMRQGLAAAQLDSQGLADVEQGLLGQTASPDAAASTVAAVTSEPGLATVLLASSELTAAQVVRVGTMGKTVPSCAPVKEGSATQ
ncbi:hypothetical protein PAMP_018767 [Pampus punctatissimus]